MGVRCVRMEHQVQLKSLPGNSRDFVVFDQTLPRALSSSLVVPKLAGEQIQKSHQSAPSSGRSIFGNHLASFH